MANQGSVDTESLANKPPVPPREELVNTAAKFLSSPNVQKSPNDMKTAFLKKKGLSDAEIELAFKKCESILQTRAVDVLQYPAFQHLPPPVHWSQSQKWLTFRDFVNSIVLIAGFAYGIYWLYKKYIWNYLFGKSEKKKTSDDRLAEIEANLSSVVFSIDYLKKSIDSKSALTKEIHEVKAEVASVKKLLLSRQQFPSAGSAPLSIPSWQIAAAAVSDEKEEEGAATNGSDSSLEMIKE